MLLFQRSLILLNCLYYGSFKVAILVNAANYSFTRIPTFVKYAIVIHFVFSLSFPLREYFGRGRINYVHEPLNHDGLACLAPVSGSLLGIGFKRSSIAASISFD